jgi:hypothetical protein
MLVMRSNIKRQLAIAGVVSAVAAPAAVALAQENTTPAPAQPAPAATTATSTPKATIAAKRKAAKNRHVRRAVRLKRRIARMEGTRVRRGYASALRTWPLPRVRGRVRTHQRQLRALRRYRVPAGLRGTLNAIANCESHGNPRAIGGGGRYRGKYQFDYGTWASVGGKGDPAAASEREQDYRAAKLYRRAGSAPWPVCGR